VENLIDRTIEPRLNQIFIPLLSIIDNGQARKDLRDLARGYNREMLTDRGMDMEAQVLQVIRDLREAGEPLALKGITSWFADRHGEEYDRKITPKWIGYIIRKRLHLKTHKSNGAFVIEADQKSLIERLFRKYGIEGEEESSASIETSSGDFGDVGDFRQGSKVRLDPQEGLVNGLGF
jgi:hypothetical protein